VMKSVAVFEKLCCLIFASFWMCITSAGQVTAIKAGRLIDSDSGTVLTDHTIMIRDNQFDAVEGSLAIPPNATLKDVSLSENVQFVMLDGKVYKQE